MTPVRLTTTVVRISSTSVCEDSLQRSEAADAAEAAQHTWSAYDKTIHFLALILNHEDANVAVYMYN